LHFIASLSTAYGQTKLRPRRNLTRVIPRVKFLDARIQNELDKLYDDGTLYDARMEELASAHLRTAEEVWRTPPVSPVLCG